MDRGFFSFITNNDAYKDAQKDWYIELDSSTVFWYDMIVNANDAGENFNTRNSVIEYLRWLKLFTRKNLNKRFVYFICSRKKVRFNTKKKPIYNFLTGKFKIHLLVGKEAKKVSIKVKGEGWRGVEITEKYITFINYVGGKVTASVHDFLKDAGITLGISTEVHYVGLTKHPDARPTNGSHTGLTDTLCEISNEDNDILVYFNLFKVTSNATSKYGLNFHLSNAMADEIDIDTEGSIIEKCFILYFDSKIQTRNRENEVAELKGNLVEMVSNNKINSIQFYYECAESGDYWMLSSSAVNSQLRHNFTVALTNGVPSVAFGSKIFSEVVEPWV